MRCEGECVGACVNGVDRGLSMITHSRNVDVHVLHPNRGRPRFEFPVETHQNPINIPHVKFLPKKGRDHNLFIFYKLNV